MTATAPHRRVDAVHPTEPLEPARPLDRDTFAFERPEAGRYLVLEEDGLVQLIPVLSPVMHIGRGFGVDLRLEDQSVSRRHAIIIERDGQAHILDDRSANGTFVNGRQVGEAPLRDRDVVRIGRVGLIYVDVSA